MLTDEHAVCTVHSAFLQKPNQTPIHHFQTRLALILYRLRRLSVPTLVISGLSGLCTCVSWLWVSETGTPDQLNTKTPWPKRWFCVESVVLWVREWANDDVTRVSVFQLLTARVRGETTKWHRETTPLDFRLLDIRDRLTASPISSGPSLVDGQSQWCRKKKNLAKWVWHSVKSDTKRGIRPSAYKRISAVVISPVRL